MRAWIVVIACAALGGKAQQPFSVKDVLSAPYALGLTVAPQGARVAWVENAEGVHNLWVAGASEAPHPITRYEADDGQDIGGLAWSPDGLRIAYALGAENGQGGRPANPAELQRNTAVAVWVAETAGRSAPVRVGEGHAPLFLADGRLLLVRGGQIWVAEAGGQRNGAREGNEGGATQLVFDRGSASGLTVSPDGKLLAYVSRRRGHSFIGLYDFAAHTLRFVAPSTGSDSAPSFSPDAKQIAWLREPWTDVAEFAGERVSANPWSVQVASLDDLNARTVYQAEAGKWGSVVPRFATGNPRVWWAAGGRLLFCSEADGWVHLYAALPGERAALLTPMPGEVEDVSISADGRTAMWASNQELKASLAEPHVPGKQPGAAVPGADSDLRHIWRLDLTRAGAQPERVTSGAGIETRPVALSDGKLAAMASSARLPMHPVWVSKDGGKLEDVREGWLPVTYPAQALVVPQQVVFASKLGEGAQGVLMVHGQVFDQKGGGTTPGSVSSARAGSGRSSRSTGSPARGAGEDSGDATLRRPAIVFFHGGPKRQMLLGYPAMDYYSNAYAMNQYLASQGYIVLSVNYRCGIGYGLEFRQCQQAGADGASEYQDALAAVAYLRSRGDVDTERIGIWGGSYGGYFTALGLARNSDLFRAGVDFHGVHDWTLEDNARNDWLRGTNAEVDAIGAKAKASSPIAGIARWKSPVLLIHGDDDPEVTYNQTPMLADALRARGVTVEELVFPDEVHGFLLHRDWVKAYEAEADFFQRQLKGRQ